MTVKIDLKTGKHSHHDLSGLAELVTEHLRAAGIDGRYGLAVGPAVRGTSQTPRFRAVRTTQRGNIEVYVKPGSNDTAKTCWLAPEDGTGLPPLELFRRLREAPPADDGAEQEGSPACRFSDDPKKVDNLVSMLVELAGGRGEVPIALVRRELNARCGQASNTAWGAVLSAIERQGRIAIRRSGRNLAAVMPLTGSRQPAAGLPAVGTEGSPAQGLEALEAALVKREDELAMAVLTAGEQATNLRRQLALLESELERDEKLHAEVTKKLEAVRTVAGIYKEGQR